MVEGVSECRGLDSYVEVAFAFGGKADVFTSFILIMTESEEEENAKENSLQHREPVKHHVPEVFVVVDCYIDIDHSSPWRGRLFQ
jgi:hypothetical protein